MARKILKASITDQVVLRLKDEIHNGKYRDGEQLPSLTDIAEQFGVGVSTAREALRKLEALEMVEIIHGKGTFVIKKQMHWEAKFTSFSEIVRQWGKIPGAKLIEAKTLEADDKVAAQLSIRQGDKVHFLRRLRLADGAPIAIENSYLPEARFPELLDLYQDPMSLYQLLQTNYNTHLIAGLQTLSAVLLSDSERDLLGAEDIAPGLLVDTIAYDAKSVPVEYGSSLFKADTYRYVVRLSR